MIDPDLIARHFPDRGTGYFDHAAVGTAPVDVAFAVARVAHALAGGVTGSHEWHEATDGATDLHAVDFGVPPDRLVVLANTGGAVNAVARAIPFAAGDEVVTFADDFPSVRLPWAAVPGITVRELDPGEGDERTSVACAAIREATRVVAVTHVHASTGTVIDLERLGAACREVGALLVVDAAQAAGLLTGGARHADVYIGAAYKWLLAGFGAAVVATSLRFDEEAVPGLLGYANAPPSRSLAVGHSNLFGLAALQAAADVRHRIGLEAIRAHTQGLIARITAGAADLDLALASRHAGAGIVSLDVLDAPALARSLRERGIVAAARAGLLRLSPYLTTHDSDVDRLLTALDDLAPRYRRGARHPGTGAR